LIYGGPEKKSKLKLVPIEPRNYSKEPKVPSHPLSN